MSFELSRRFDGVEIIRCQIVLWIPSKLFTRIAATSAKTSASSSSGGVGLGPGSDKRMKNRAPHADSNWFGLEGSWEPQVFLLDPRQGAIKIGMSWILISDIDAASQFPVEKEHAVAFPYENKQVYVSGHVGLHLHSESTGQTFTMAFPNFELADVAFDAVNRLSYDYLSQNLFSDSENDDDDENDGDKGASDDDDDDDDENVDPAASLDDSLDNASGYLNEHQQPQNQMQILHLPKRLQRRAPSSSASSPPRALSLEETTQREIRKQERREEKRRQREMKRQQKALFKQQEKLRKQHQEQRTKQKRNSGGDHDDDDDNFVASSGSELVERGRRLNVNEFTTHFLEGGGMGSLSAESAEAQSAGPSGAPSNGIIRVRKETGTLSTWIARLEPGDADHVYFLKLSKALVKAPLNRLIRWAIPSVAQLFGPVVPLRFDCLTVRSESFRSEFILEEVYVNLHGDKRVHRLMCVFHSLEERIRWEEWLCSRGVVKRAIESDKEGNDKKKKKAGGEGGAEGGTDGEKNAGVGGESKNAMDTTMALVWECFRLDEVWQKAKPLRKSDSKSRSPLKKRTSSRRDSGAFGPYVQDEYNDNDDDDDDDDYCYNDHQRHRRNYDDEDDDDDRDESSDVDYEDDGAQGLPFVADTPRFMENQDEYVQNRNASLANFSNVSFASSSAATAMGRARELSQLSAGNAKSPRAASSLLSSPTASEKKIGSKKSTGGKSPGDSPTRSRKMVEKSPEELASEQEALERCRWFAGYQPAKKNKWAELSETVNKERAAGSGLLSAVKLLKSKSTVSQGEDAGTMHAPGGSPLASQTSASSTKLSAILRARQLKKAMEALDEAEKKKSSGTGEDSASSTSTPQTPDSPTLKQQISAIRSLNAIEAAAEEESSCRSEHQQQPDDTATLLQQNSQFFQRGKLFEGPSSALAPSFASSSPSPSSSPPFTKQQNDMSSVSSFSPISRQPQRQDEEIVVVPTTETGSGRNTGSSNKNQNVSAVSLFGGPLRPKYPQINLRSEGFVNDNDIVTAMLRRATNEPVVDGTTLQSTLARSGSPAANEARKFRFDFNSTNNNNNNNNNNNSNTITTTSEPQQQQQQQQQQAGSLPPPPPPQSFSPLFGSPKNSLMGDYSVAGISSLGRKNAAMIGTSSDSSDDDQENRRSGATASASSGSDRFKRARAMRAVSQLGEEFVGVGFSDSSASTPSGRRPVFAGSSSSPSSLLSSHLSPTCPLCGADRLTTAICKKTGRLHATYDTPRFAAASSGRY